MIEEFGFPVYTEDNDDATARRANPSTLLRIGFALLFCAVVPSCPLPAPPEEEVDPSFTPVPLETYLPLARGTAWTYDFVTKSSQESKAVHTVSLEIVDAFEYGRWPVWEIDIEAPWFLILFFRVALGSFGEGYVVRVGEEHFFTADLTDLDALPSTDGLTPVPLPSILRSETTTVEWSGEPLTIRYSFASVGDVFPQSVNLSRFAPEVSLDAPCVSITTWDAVTGWSEPRAVLAEGVGVVYGANTLGDFYLRSVSLPDVVNNQDEKADLHFVGQSLFDDSRMGN